MSATYMKHFLAETNTGAIINSVFDVVCAEELF
jgi:hypothetical protein